MTRNDSHADIHRRLDEIQQTVSRIDHSLRGNGKPGLVTRVTLLEHWRAGRDRLAWVMVGLAGSCVASVAVIMVKTWVGA